MKRLFLLLALVGVLGISCSDKEETTPNQPQTPTEQPEDNTGSENDDDQVTNIPNNEIWYTTTDGNKLFPPTTEPAIFGAFLVSNTYSDGKGVLTFDDDITLIGGSAFSGCTTLATITIPESATTIGDYAFSSCSSLTSVTIPDSVTTIGKSAFSGCSSLTSVTIPDSVTSIGMEAFKGSTGELFVNCNIPDGNYYSYYGVFSGSKFTSVAIGDSVTTIGYAAFSGCSSLTSVTIPDSVTTIRDYAFRGCSSLTSVTIPDSVTTIRNDAFEDCSSLTSVYISDLSAWCRINFGSYDANPLYYAGNLYLNNELITDLVIPSDITEIKSYAFSGCRSLTGVTIPDSVTTIGWRAFYVCSSLTRVYSKAVTPPVGGYLMFYNNASGRTIYVPTESVEAYKSAEYWSDYKSYIVGYEF